MYQQPKWGNVNLGVDVLQGHGEQSQPGYEDWLDNHPNSERKMQYNPGRNQELKLPPDIFRMQKDSDRNPYSPNGKINRFSMHERIKELLGEGQPRRYAIAKAKQEAREAVRGDVGTISNRELYKSKYQTPQISKQITPFTEQVQNYPFL